MKANDKIQQQLNEVEKRRWQLWALALLLVVFFATAVTTLSYWEGVYNKVFSTLTNFRTVLALLLLLVITFCGYIIEKEIILRRLSRQLIEEQVRSSHLDQKVDQISSMLKAGKAINSTLDSKKIMDDILKEAFSLLGASQGSVMLINERTKLLEIVSSHGLNPEIVKKARVRVGESIGGWVAKNGKPLLLSGEVSSNKFKNFVRKKRVIKSSMVVPLKAKDKVIGILSLSIGENQKRKFNKQDLNAVLVFAEQVATAIGNAHLYEQTKNSQEKLASLNEELAQRNKEFKKANADLKQANKELEKFNRLTINRELQMIKFKEEIKRLEARLSTKSQKIDKSA